MTGMAWLPFRRPTPVKGVIAEGPRLTGWAALYFFGFVAAPFLLVCLALDVALYFLFKHVFHSCYGVLCLFD